MNVTLTGASGHLGSVVCRWLVEHGYHVRAVDRRDGADLPVRLELVDVLDPVRCYRVLDGADALVHLANHPGYRPGENEQRIFNENVSMNMNLFQAARETGVKKIVFASSVQVISGLRYGPSSNALPPPYLPFDGSTPPRPGNPYALSKHVSEQMLAYFVRAGIPTGVAIRYPGLIAPKSRPHRRGTTASCAPEGFAWLMTSDAAALVEAVLRSSVTGFRIYFPAARGNGAGKPVADVVREFYDGVPLRQPMEQIESLVDISAITQETGWVPQVNEL